MQVKVGTALRSAVCDGQFMVVRGSGELDLRCGGAPLLGPADDRVLREPAAELSTGSLLGKRYVDDAGQVELLCVKASRGTLSMGDEPLKAKEAKVLPSSD